MKEASIEVIAFREAPAAWALGHPGHDILADVQILQITSKLSDWRTGNVAAVGFYFLQA